MTSIFLCSSLLTVADRLHIVYVSVNILTLNILHVSVYNSVLSTISCETGTGPLQNVHINNVRTKPITRLNREHGRKRKQSRLSIQLLARVVA